MLPCSAYVDLRVSELSLCPTEPEECDQICQKAHCCHSHANDSQVLCVCCRVDGPSRLTGLRVSLDHEVGNHTVGIHPVLGCLLLCQGRAHVVPVLTQEETETGVDIGSLAVLQLIVVQYGDKS